MRRICTRVTWLAVLAALSAFAPRQANAQLVISVDEEDLYVQHMDVNTTAFTNLFRPDESTLPPGAGTDGPEGIAADESNRVFYWQDQARLYRTFFDLRDTNGFMVSEYIADMQCTTCTSITTMDGLTYANGVLYGVRNSSGSTTGPEGIYSIDVNTGAATLILDFTTDPGVGSVNDIDVRSIAYNSANGLFYIFNNDNSTGFSGGGAGIYSVDIDNVLGGGANAIALVEATPDVTLICSGCGTSTTPDIDGMAIGDGKLYLTIDQPGDILVYDLATNLFDPSFTNQWAATELAAGATWAPSALAQPAGVANLRNALAVTTNGNDLINDGNVGLGDQIVYTLTNENQGSEVAGSMMYEIEFTGSASISVASAVGGLSTPVINGNTVTGVLAPFAIGQPEMVTITVDTLGAGFVTATASVQPGGAFPDPFQLDNTKTHTAEVRDFPYVNAICYTERLPEEGGNGTSSTIFGHPSLGGVFQVSILTSTNTIIRPPYASPDGRYVGFVVTTTLDDAINDIVVLGEDGVFSAVAQQAVTTASDSMLTLDEFILHPRLIPNNSGHFAINAATTSGNNRGIFEWTGTGFTTLVQTGDAIPAFNDPGITYGDTSISWGGVNFDGSGRFGTFLDFVDGLTSGQDQLLLANSGLSLLAHSETNGPMGTAENWNDAFNDDTFWLDGAGFDWIVQGGLTGSTLSDGVVAVNNQIVIQEDSVIPGLTSNTSTLEYAQMAANGEWFAYGSTDDATEDWMVKGDGTSFSLLAKGGDPIYPGAPDNWDDATGQPSDSFSQGFHFVASNTQGDYIITGRTDRANRRKNTVCVLNGTTEVLREGDPIDVDGNGLFDDNRYVRTFDEHTAVLTPSGDFYCVVDMTDTTDSGDSGPEIGRALIHLVAPVSAQATGADIAVRVTGSTTKLNALGQQMTYTIEVCNRGPEDATNIALTCNLPAEFSFVSGTNGVTENPPASGMLSASIASLSAYACEVFEVTVQAEAENGAVVTSASASTVDQADPKPANNTGSAAAVEIVNEVDVGVSKIDNGGAPVGQNYDYTITVTNDGPAPATNVVVRDTLPAGVSFVTASVPFTQNGSDIDVTIALVGPGTPFQYTITVTALAQELVTNTLTLLSVTEVDTNPANDTFSLDTINGSVADLEITKTDSGVTPLGENITYTIDVTNLGPGAATGVVVTETLPTNVNLVSVSVPYMEVLPGVLEINYASIAAFASEQITVVLTPLGEASYINQASVTATEVDPDDGNNLATTITRAGAYRDINLVYSEISGHSSAEVPGTRDLAGALTFSEFNSVADLEVSPDGTAWFINCTNSLGTDLANTLLIGGGTTGDVLAQEGQPVPGEAGEVWDFMDGNAGFNNNNDLAWNARSRGGTTSDDEIVLRRLSGVDTIAFKEGDVLSGALTTGDAPAPSAALGSSIGLVHLRDDNTIGWYCTPITNVSSFYYPLLGVDLVVFLQSRANQIDGVNWDSFDSSDAFRTTPDGLHTLILGDDEGSTATDLVLVYDGVVVLREGDLVGSLGAMADVFATKLVPNGDWYARGDDVANLDYAYKNGVLIAESGASVLGGAETWGDILTLVNGNRMGDYIVAGNTSEPDTNYDNVLVMNGDTLVMREGDPVDLDGNGLFDDGVFINSFQPDDTFITDDRLVLSLVTLRDSEGTSLGDAFIQVQITDTGCATISGDVDGDGDGDGDDIQGAVICILTNGASGGSCDCIDYNNSGSPDVGDIADFVADLLDN